MTSGQCYCEAVLDQDAGCGQEELSCSKSNITRKSEEEVCLRDLQDWPGLQLFLPIKLLLPERITSQRVLIFISIVRHSFRTVCFTNIFKFAFKVA